MKIKKPAKSPAAPAAPGGAVIADRFRLDAPPPPKASASGPATTTAFFVALVALGVAGMLTYMLWKHWEFLMPA